MYFLKLLRRWVGWKSEDGSEEEAHVVENGGNGGVDVKGIGARREPHERRDQWCIEG